MLLESIWHAFESRLFNAPSTPELFNPYTGFHPDLDIPNAPAIRRQNLRNYLSSFTQMPTLLLVGEAPGPNGCRFSGVPFTNEYQLFHNLLPFKGQPTSQTDKLYAEVSANVMWETLRDCHPHFLLWNSIPLHPHRPDDFLSIRTPKTAEIFAYLHVLESLITILQPAHVLAVGHKAENALNRLGTKATYIRHPSHGGVNDFKGAIRHYIQENEICPLHLQKL